MSTCTCTVQNKMVNKSYLRYDASACFGIVCSSKSNGLLVKGRPFKSSKHITQYAACPALKDVIIWDVKRGDKVFHLATTECRATLNAGSAARQ